MKQQPRFGAVGWISEAHPPSLPPGGCAALIHPTRATRVVVSFSGVMGTLNMIVKAKLR